MALAAAQHLKRGHLERGGKAPAVVFADADLPAAAKALGEFGCVWVHIHVMLTSEMPHGGFENSSYGKDLSLCR